MSKMAIVKARLEPDLKEHAEDIFQKLGLSVTQAITLFYKQVEIKKGLPFNVVIPNDDTLEVFDNTDQDKNLVICKDTKELFDKLGI